MMYELIIPNIPISTDLQLVQYGYEKCPTCHDSGKNFRTYFLVHLVVSGAGYYTISGTTYYVKARTMFLIPPGKVVNYHADENDPYEFFWLGFNGADAKAIIPLSIFRNTYVYDGELFDVALNNVRELVELKTNGLKINFAKLRLLISFLESIVEVTRDSDGDCQYHEDITQFEKAEKYIAQNFQTVTVSELSKLLLLSRSGIFRLFKKKVDVSPMAYIVNFRLDQALLMVEQTKIKITDIAAICGFYDNNYFTKAFKRKFIRSPISVRKNHITTK